MATPKTEHIRTSAGELEIAHNTATPKYYRINLNSHNQCYQNMPTSLGVTRVIPVSGKDIGIYRYHNLLKRCMGSFDKKYPMFAIAFLSKFHELYYTRAVHR